MISCLSGSNSYAIEQEKKAVVAKFRDEFGDFAIEQINCDEVEYQLIHDSLLNISFLTPKKLVVLMEPSLNKEFAEAFEGLIKQIPDTTDVLIIESAIDKRSTFYKQLKKLTNFVSFSDISGSELTNWITQKVSSQKGSISSSAANYLIEVAGSNQLRLNNEINKLITYNSEISRGSIDLLVEPLLQSTIFQLLDAVFNGNSKELLRIYEEQKQQKVQPQQIMALLAWQVHILALVKTAGKATPSEIASKAKLNPYVVTKSLNIVRNLSFEDIKNLSDRLVELDIKLKSQTLDTDEALLQLLLSIAN